MPMTLSAAPRPSLALFTSEPVRAAVDLLQHLTHGAPAAPVSSDGHTVVLFPGLGANALSMWPLQRHLSGAGYRALDWGQGFNIGPSGDIDAWLQGLTQHVLARVDEAGAQAEAPISLVGWSLGGFDAREIAKLVP